MKNTKVYTWLKNCSDYHLAQLQMLLNTPETKRELVNLYLGFVRHLHEDYPKEKLYTEVFKEKKFNGNKFRKACHELLKLAEQKIVCLYLDEHPNLQDNLRLQFYSSNGWTEHYADLFAEIKLTEQKHFERFSFAYLDYMHGIINPQKSNSLKIKIYSDSLDHFYLLEKMKLICHAQNESHFTKFSYQPDFTAVLLPIIQNKIHTDALLHCYYLSYLMLLHTDKEHAYFEIKQQLAQTQIPLADKKIIFQYLINFCIIRINKSEQQFERELFEVFKLYYSIITENEISPFRFKNVINLSLKLKEYTYAEYFNTTYGELLDISIRESTVIFNQAKIAFEMKQYDTTLMFLHKARFDDLTFNLSSRILITKTFYEQKEMQFLENYLESFRIYILRNKAMNSGNKKLHQDFIKLIRQLMRKEYAGKKQTEAFKQKINAVPNLPDKFWILEKVEEL
ncbi:MAG TPA: hypothetical protein PLF48_02895 [Chitinophagales bacterium]|nr:hypothetical protein [Chitinophagales bacterium]